MALDYTVKDSLNWLRANCGHFDACLVGHGELRMVADRAVKLLRASGRVVDAGAIEEAAEMGDTNLLRVAIKTAIEREEE